MIVDLANLQWWQALIGIVGVLGLSPAPWLLGMARGRIQFTGPADEARAREVASIEKANDARTADLKAQHADAITSLTTYHTTVIADRDRHYAELKESRDYYREARIVERDRADKVTDQLAEALELARLNSHLLTAFNEATKGGDGE